MIKLIIGPMFSGKTSELLRLLVRAKIAGKKVILLRPETDTREFLTHDGKGTEIEERFVNIIQFKDYLEYDVIGVDEGQFIQNLSYQVNLLSDVGKEIIISGLNGTSERTTFESIQNLIPQAEEIIKLNAICSSCGSEYGSFTFYKPGKKVEEVIIGGTDCYTALCRDCWNKSYKGV